MSEEAAMAAAVEAPPKKAFDWNKIVQSPAFWPGVVAALAIGVCFWALLKRLPGIWTKDDYYSHGFLVPLITGYILYKWWPRLRQIPVRPGWFALIPLALVLFAVRASYITGIMQLMSGGLLLTLMLGVWFVAGWRWMLATALPILYLVFMLPVWTGAIDNYTNPLQLVSTKVAFFLLNATGFEPWADGSTVIYLNNFTLDVGVPCSGLKLVLAVTAFTAFFVLIARLNFWGNLVMIGMILPLCLLINGLRIALIGVVGDYYGAAAGMQFHDYSGYITLIVCFFILFKIARLLGWKD